LLAALSGTPTSFPLCLSCRVRSVIELGLHTIATTRPHGDMVTWLLLESSIAPNISNYDMQVWSKYSHLVTLVILTPWCMVLINAWRERGSGGRLESPGLVNFLKIGSLKVTFLSILNHFLTQNAHWLHIQLYCSSWLHDSIIPFSY